MADAAAQSAAESKDAAAATEAFKAEVTAFLRRHGGLIDRREAGSYAEACLRSSRVSRGLDLPALEASAPRGEPAHAAEPSDEQPKAARPRRAQKTEEPEGETSAEKPKRPRKAKTSAKPAKVASEG